MSKEGDEHKAQAVTSSLGLDWRFSVTTERQEGS